MPILDKKSSKLTTIYAVNKNKKKCNEIRSYVALNDGLASPFEMIRYAARGGNTKIFRKTTIF